MKETLRLVSAVLFAAILAIACGEEPTLPAGDGGSPDEPVASTPLPGDTDSGRMKAQMVKPRPGQSDLHMVGIDRVKKLGPRRVKVFFWSGVEPCNVLDHVDVDYRDKTVKITVFEGFDETAEDQACIEIAVYKATMVKLEEKLNGRRIVDGARLKD